jgi:hypothetical protein
MKRVLIVLAISLFVFSQFGIAAAGNGNGPKWEVPGPKCKDPSQYRWSPKGNEGNGACIDKEKKDKKNWHARYNRGHKKGKNRS